MKTSNPSDDWAMLRTLPPMPRLAYYELMACPTCSTCGVPGLWANAQAMLRPWGVAEQHAAACGAVVALDGWLWFAPRLRADIELRRPDAAALAAWKRALAPLDESLRARIEQDVAAALQTLPRHQSLLKVWSGQRSRAPRPCSDVDWVVDLYHVLLPGLPRVLCMTPQRVGLVQARLREMMQGRFGTAHSDERQAMQQYFERVARSDFLCGRSSCGFHADFEWLMRPNNFLKVMEGCYDNRDQADRPSGAFMRFWRIYPVQQGMQRAWQVWRQMGLDSMADVIVLAVQDDQLRYGGGHRMPAAWRYLQQKTWEGVPTPC